MVESDWYEVTQGGGLLQGDTLSSCPIFTVAGPITWPLTPREGVSVEIHTHQVVVMTQSCDLANDKVKEVLLAQVAAWSDLVREETEHGNQAAKGSRFRRLLIDGHTPGLSLLHKREQAPVLPWSVVNFHRLFTLPVDFLKSFVAASGPRLRLRSPYREHLAQAFARYFMRVGLPHDARAFEKEGDVAP